MSPILQTNEPGMCDDRHRHQEWLKFLRVIDHASGKRSAPDRRQLCHAQTPESAALAGTPSALPYPLHTDRQFVAEHGGKVFPRPHAKPVTARCFSRRRRTDHGHRRIHRQTQPEPQAFHLDREGLRYPRKGQACPAHSR